MNGQNLTQIVLITGLGLAGLIILLIPIEPMMSRVGREIWDLSHFVFFAFISLALVHWFSKQKPEASYSFYYKSFILLICIAVAAEGIQFFSPSRDASILDVTRNILGVIAGFVLKLSRPKRIVAMALAVLLALLPALPVFIDEAQMRRQFPVLTDTLSPNFYSFQHIRWLGIKKHKCGKEDVAGKCGFIHTIENKKYSGASLISLKPDWTGYEALVLTIWSDRAGMITLRVHDFQHLESYEYKDRFNQTIQLSEGLNLISILTDEIENGPSSRKMNMSEIHQLMLFSTRPHSISTLIIERIELVNK